MRRIFSMLACVCLALPALAQTGLTNITASHLESDMSGALLTGKLCLTPVLGTNPTAFTANGGAQVLQKQVCYPITAGVLNISVPDTALAQPSGIGYKVAFTLSNGFPLYSYSQPIYPTGTTWSLDAWTPTQTANVTSTTVNYSALAPSGNCGTAPAIWYTSTNTYSCINQVWTPLPGGGGGAQADWTAVSGPSVVLHKPTLATVATSGSWGDLSNKPAISGAAQPYPSSTTILQAANNGANQVIRVGVKGDSFTINSRVTGNGNGPTLPSNRWAEQLRIEGQATWGSHGTGVFPVIGDSSGDVNPMGWACTGIKDTANLSLGPYTGSSSNVLHMTTGATCTFNDNARSIPYTNLSVYYATPSTTSSLAIVADGSTSMGTLTSANSTQAGAVNGGLTARRYDSATVLPATAHSVVFTCTGDCYLYAADGVIGTTGFSVDLEGVSGAVAGTFGASTANQLAFDALIPGGEQAFIYMDQTNDAAGSVATATFQTNITNIINYEQGLSSRPTVMLAIPPVDVINNSHAMAPYTAIQTNLCTSLNLTCVNLQSRGTTVGGTSVGWGTAYNSASGLWDLTGASPGVHPNDAGNLDEFQMIYAQLFNPIAASSGASAGPNFTTPVTITGGGSGTTVINTTFNEASAGSTLIGTAPATDTVGSTWLLAAGSNSGATYQTGPVGKFGPGSLVTEALLNTGFANETITLTNVSLSGTGSQYLQFFVRANGTSGTGATQALILTWTSGGAITLQDIGTVTTPIASGSVGATTTGNIVFTLNGTSVSVNVFGTVLSGTVPSNTPTLAFHNFTVVPQGSTAAYATIGQLTAATLTGAPTNQFSVNSLFKVDSNGNTTLPSYAVASLPSASSLAAGTTVIVTDATTFTPGVCTGGGTDYMLAVTNGTAWSCH